MINTSLQRRVSFQGQEIPKALSWKFSIYAQKYRSQWRWNFKQISLISAKFCVETVTLLQKTPEWLGSSLTQTESKGIFTQGVGTGWVFRSLPTQTLLWFHDWNEEAKRENALSNPVLAHGLFRVWTVTGISVLTSPKSGFIIYFGVYFSWKINLSLRHSEMQSCSIFCFMTNPKTPLLMRILQGREQWSHKEINQ